jgi:hypothetical protein
MAVHCGACGKRLSSAMENYDSFQVDEDFKGWDVNEQTGYAAIKDTCASCASVFREAITHLANEIVEKNIDTVSRLRKEIEDHRAYVAKLKKEKEQFERDWVAHKMENIDRRRLFGIK